MFPEQSFTPLFASAVFSNLEQSHQLRANTNMNFFSPNPVQYDNGYPYFAAPTSMKPTQVVIAEARMMSAMYENHRAATSTVTPAQMAEAFAQIASNVSPSAPIMHTAATHPSPTDSGVSSGPSVTEFPELVKTAPTKRKAAPRKRVVRQKAEPNNDAPKRGIKRPLEEDTYPTERYECPVCGSIFAFPALYAGHLFEHSVVAQNHPLFFINSVIEQLLPVKANKKAKKGTTEKTSEETVAGADRPNYGVPDQKELGVVVPKVLQKRTVRTITCRTCGKILITRIDYWLHLRAHYGNTKKHLLCAMCPFAASVKHHMEFHNKKHTGEKPFNCDDCGYACVNKSMLTSHIKQHMEYSLYYCKDCSFEAKFLNTYKSHLIKKKHTVGLVLDKEGNPVENFYIDLYGRKRGPRVKKSKVTETKTKKKKTTSSGTSSPDSLSSEEVPVDVSPAEEAAVSAALEQQCAPPTNGPGLATTPPMLLCPEIALQQRAVMEAAQLAYMRHYFQTLMVTDFRARHTMAAAVVAAAAATVTTATTEANTSSDEETRNTTVPLNLATRTEEESQDVPINLSKNSHDEENH